MKRYTSYYEKLQCYVVDNNKLDKDQEEMGYYDTFESIYVGGAIDRLAEYENAEEEGLLLRLPCKPGDTVYVVGTKCLSGLYDIECDMHDAETDCPCHLEEEWIVFKREVDVDMLVNIMKNSNPNFIFGETVFCTRDEAEDKLVEIIESNGEVN